MTLARRHDADAGHAEQQLLERLAVRRAVAAATAHRRAHHERHRHLVVEHLPELRDAVDDLVEAERDEVAEHDLEDGAPTAQRHAGGDTEQRRFGDRGRQHAVGPAVGEPLAHLERAAVGIEQVLAEQDHVVPTLEEVDERAVEHLDATGRCAHSPATGAASAASTVSVIRRSTASSIDARTLSSRRAPAIVSGSRARRSSISARSRKSSPLECGLKR